MKYMGKATDVFGRSKYQLPQNSPFEAKTCAAGRANNIELLMLVLDFTVNSKLKIHNGISVESMECLNKDA